MMNRKSLVLIHFLIAVSCAYGQEYGKTKSVIWEETFDTNKNDWYVGNDNEIKYGRYYIAQNSSKNYRRSVSFNINHLPFKPNKNFKLDFEFKILNDDYKSVLNLGFEYRGNYVKNGYSQNNEGVVINGIGEITIEPRCSYEKVHSGRAQNFRVSGMNKITFMYFNSEYFIFINDVLFDKFKCGNNAKINNIYTSWFVIFGIQNGKAIIYNIKLWAL